MGDAIRPHLFDAADGTAALPSYTFLNDRDTGFYRAAANQLGVALGGAAKLLYSAGAFAFQEATTISSTSTLTLGAMTFGGIATLPANQVFQGGTLMLAGAATPPNPDSLLHVWSGSAGTVAAEGGTILTIEGSANDVGWTSLGPDAGEHHFKAGCPTNAAHGQISYTGPSHAVASTWRVFTAAVERLRYSAGAFAFQEATIISTTAGALILNPSTIVAIGSGEGGTTVATGKTLRAPNIATGGAGNIAGADLTIAAGLGTGTGDVGTVIFSLPIVAAAGDNIQTTAARLTLDMAGGSSLYVESAGTGAAGMILKNMKNAAATALSGTQLDVEIDIGGTPYYFTVYPTKA